MKNKNVKLCECGCGKPAPIAKYTSKKHGWVKGEPKRFIHNHHHRGHRNVNFNMGLTFDESQNRWFIKTRDHRNIAFARAVMEAHLGRSLTSEEEVHHINGDSTDDRLENLEFMKNHKEHMRNHVQYTDEDLLSRLKNLYHELGRIPRSSDLKERSNLPSRGTYRRRLGGLVKARKLAGINTEVNEV